MTADTPRVSVIMPAYHSHRTLPECLEALRRQTFRDFEVIVINSSPECRTAEVLCDYPEVRFEQSSDRLLPHDARNRGVELARGEILVFTDPDCCAATDWLHSLVEAHGRGYRAVVGAMALMPGGGWFERGIHLCKFHWLLNGLRPTTKWIAPTANASYTRSLWKEIGPFDPGLFAADGLLTWRAARRGYPAQFEPRAVVRHYHHATVKEFWQERYSRGEEFGESRAAIERWSAWRRVMHGLTPPLRAAWVLLRSLADSRQAGQLGVCLVTLPVQFLGQFAWCLGESRAFLRFYGAKHPGVRK